MEGCTKVKTGEVVFIKIKILFSYKSMVQRHWGRKKLYVFGQPSLYKRATEQRGEQRLN